MPKSRGPRSRLHVEGTDDSHALRHLLIRHGMDYNQNPWPVELPRIEDIGGKPEVLEGVETAVRLSNGRSVGFVLDANLLDSEFLESSLFPTSRNRHGGSERDSTGRICPETLKTTVLALVCGSMPDNQREGKLEHFLRDLIEDDDPFYFPTPKNPPCTQRHWARVFPTMMPTRRCCTLGSRGNRSPAGRMAPPSERGTSVTTALRPQAFVTWFRAGLQHSPNLKHGSAAESNRGLSPARM